MTMTRTTTRVTTRTTTILTLAALTALAGCSQSRFGGPGYAALQPQQPAPVASAPTGQVQTGALAPVSGAPQSLPRTNGPNNDPNQPLPGAVDTAQGQQPQQNTQVASIDPVVPTTPAAPAAPASGGPAISENSLIGNWQTSANGQSCATFFGLTDLGSGLLGGTRGCSGDLSKFRTWKVAGNRATLRDSTGQTVATLSRTGDKSFSGTTASGQPITLTR